MPSVSVDVDTGPVQAMLGELLEKMADLTPVMQEIGEIIVTQSAEAFEQGGLPGHKWPESARVKASGGQTLVDSARLKNSITARASGNKVEVGTNVVYAAIHQFGGKTSPRTIRPKNKKALFWPGASHPVMSVRHPGSTIPARPFLPDEQSLDWDEIRDTLTRYLV
jgi:phage virion morphogenesis protein